MAEGLVFNWKQVWVTVINCVDCNWRPQRASPSQGGCCPLLLPALVCVFLHCWHGVMSRSTPFPLPGFHGCLEAALFFQVAGRAQGASSGLLLLLEASHTSASDR